MRWRFRRCRRCTAHFVPEAEDITYCAACTPATLAPLSDEPRQAWELTPIDCSFLRALHIRPEA